MQDLIQQERFELEVLDRLNSIRMLNDLVLGGGTMLRLCFGLDRYSVDLDFWIIKELDREKLFERLNDYFSKHYTVKDAANKFNTLLFELKSRDYPRSLKIEIRKELKKIKTERAIAYSPHSSTQVYVRVVSLADMMRAKIDAFLERREIRDAFDMEFLLKRGIALNAPTGVLDKLLAAIDDLTPRDYSVKLGSLLEKDARRYYTSENFKILKQAIWDCMGTRGNA
jgi:predicted nucleotidyltransferase component of viral defense system